MLRNGYAQEVAERCFGQIEGFADYGFPESHAAAFALLAYVSAWLKCHHPAVFACALLNSQPMGFYAPAQIVRDARDHQVELRPVCVNASHWDNTLERRADGALALRLGFRQIKGFKEEDAGWIVAARGNGYRDPQSVWLRAGVAPSVLERLRAHPVELLRPTIPGLTPHDKLATVPPGQVSVCGLVITRQRPGTASGVIFLTLEDETGVSNVVVWPKTYERFRRIVMGGRLLRVTGHLQREGIVVHLIARQIEDLSPRLCDLGHPMENTIGQTTPQTDTAPRPKPPPRAMHPRDQAKRLFPSRDFH